MYQQIRGGLRRARRRHASPRVRPRSARRAGGRGDHHASRASTFEAPAEGPRAATFSELFADVFQHAGAGSDGAVARRRTSRPTCRFRFVTPLAVRGCRCRSRGRNVAATCLGRGRVTRARRELPGVRRHGFTAMGARSSRLHQGVRRVCGPGTDRQRDVPDVRGCRHGVPHGGASRSRFRLASTRVPRIAVPGHGHAGARGGPAGDLYVTIDVGAASVSAAAGAGSCT